MQVPTQKLFLLKLQVSIDACSAQFNIQACATYISHSTTRCQKMHSYNTEVQLKYQNAGELGCGVKGKYIT